MATGTIQKETAERLVWSANANAYNTYALALADMETAFNTLTDKQKRNSYIVYNETTLARIDLIPSKLFTRVATDTTGILFLAFDLKKHTRQYAKLTTSSFTVTDQSANAQSQSLALYTIF